MRKLTIIAILMAMTIQMKALTPWTKGGFETGKYRNVFVEMGYQPEAVDAKLKEVFNDVFRGPHKVYFEVGDSLGYVSDIKNNDARTEGMSYGMMIAVQMNEKDIFDRLWRWSKKYMQHQSGTREGYFAWSCKTDGTHNAEGAASDGELYFITALIFASNRWGNDTGINYKAEAQRILNCIQPKEYTPEPRQGGFPGFGPQQDGPQKMYLIDPETQLITFTPDGFGQRFTDPSYHIPAFYEVWAKWADDGRSDYWMECAKKSREFLHKAINEKTGLNGDMSQYDGSEMQMPRFPGMPEPKEGEKPRRKTRKQNAKGKHQRADNDNALASQKIRRESRKQNGNAEDRAEDRPDHPKLRIGDAILEEVYAYLRERGVVNLPRTLFKKVHDAQQRQHEPPISRLYIQALTFLESICFILYH